MPGTTNTKINDDGAILMGNLFCADGHDYEREFLRTFDEHFNHVIDNFLKGKGYIPRYSGLHYGRSAHRSWANRLTNGLKSRNIIV